MIKSVLNEVALAVRARTGASPTVIVWLAIAAFGVVMTVVFLGVAAFVWLEGLFGGAVAGLILAACFLLIAAIAILVGTLARRGVRNRAILERAARAHSGSWLLDPRLLSTVVQAGRTLGWQRIASVALVGLMAAQWARESREPLHKHDD